MKVHVSFWGRVFDSISVIQNAVLFSEYVLSVNIHFSQNNPETSRESSVFRGCIRLSISWVGLGKFLKPMWKKARASRQLAIQLIISSFHGPLSGGPSVMSSGLFRDPYAVEFVVPLTATSLTLNLFWDFRFFNFVQERCDQNVLKHRQTCSTHISVLAGRVRIDDGHNFSCFTSGGIRWRRPSHGDDQSQSFGRAETSVVRSVRQGRTVEASVQVWAINTAWGIQSVSTIHSASTIDSASIIHSAPKVW